MNEKVCAKQALYGLLSTLTHLSVLQQCATVYSIGQYRIHCTLGLGEIFNVKIMTRTLVFQCKI